MPILLKAISDSDTVLSITPDSSYPEDNGVIQINSEIIIYTSNYMGTLYGCTRGAQSTSAVSHAINSVVVLKDFFTAPSSGGGITELTGDITAGPGSGSQVASLAAPLPGDIELSDGNKVILGNSNNAWIRYDSSVDSIDFQGNTAGQTTLSTYSSAFAINANGTDSNRPILQLDGDTNIFNFISFGATQCQIGNTGIALAASSKYLLDFTTTRWLAQNAGEAELVLPSGDSAAWIIGTPGRVLQATESDVSLGVGTATDITLYLNKGTVALPIVFIGDSAGLYSPDGNALGVSSSGVDAAQFDADATAGNTRFMLWDVDSGALQRVSVGAADSGGTGFKVLRIPN